MVHRNLGVQTVRRQQQERRYKEEERKETECSDREDRGKRDKTESFLHYNRPIGDCVIPVCKQIDKTIKT